MGFGAEREQLAALSASLQFDDAINIQFTSGTTGAPKGATLTHHGILNNGFFIGEALRLGPRGQIVHSGADVPLLRDGAWRACLRDARRGDGVSRRGLRSAGDIADPGRGALHRGAWRADDVHRPARPSGVSDIRSIEPADRDHGRRAVPDRGDAPRRHADAPLGDHHRLWDDRDQPGQHANHGRRSAGAPGQHGRAGARRMSRSRSSTPRAAWCRAARRASSAPGATR